jgi:hypothetical protein
MIANTMLLHYTVVELISENTMIEFGSDGCMRWERVTPPVWWRAAGRTVIADRHLSDGTRQHMVEGHVDAGTVVGNAQVIGADDVPMAEFSARPSHLSAGVCPTVESPGKSKGA